MVSQVLFQVVAVSFSNSPSFPFLLQARVEGSVNMQCIYLELLPQGIDTGEKNVDISPRDNAIPTCQKGQCNSHMSEARQVCGSGFGE